MRGARKVAVVSCVAAMPPSFRQAAAWGGSLVRGAGNRAGILGTRLMIRSTILGLGFALALAAPGLAQTAPSAPAPAAAPAAPADSGIKAAAPDAKPAATPKHHRGHARHAAKPAPAATN